MTVRNHFRLGIIKEPALLVSALLLAGHVNAGQVVKPCSEWDLAEDFRVSPDQENPNRDRCGNPRVWRFLESDPSSFPDHKPRTYTLLPNFISDAFFISGLEAWQGNAISTSEKDRLPAIGINNTGSTAFFVGIVWPPDVILAHPLPDSFAIVGWQSPVSGIVAIKGSVTDLDNSCGNGISWSIDRFRFRNKTLAFGSIEEGGFQSFREGDGGARLRHVRVKKRDFLYFVIDPTDMSHGCDSTLLDINIKLLKKLQRHDEDGVAGDEEAAEDRLPPG